ncbi:signal peptide peptidase SppA [Archangium violaceum]|uniref:Signal peptidase n=1 Tax=Archangium violaceum Cb vi76 TaxID=1406225 RepID=A0A084SZL1_9BACT|nr:signal peptide peptidase SppA [Archangium violaceum]KFA93896.1 signal peptidase [Archangium violaceum Cb vi76]
MRFLVIPLINLLVLLRVLLGLPFRLLGARSRPAYVRFRLAGEPSYRERTRRSRLPPSLGGQGRPEPATVTSLESFREALALLAKDPKVKGILLILEDLEVPPAKQEALVKLLGDFRAAGKRVVAWAVGVGNVGYQVMCAADEVLLSPAGRLDLMGFAAEATALGEGLGRLGIKAHFFRRGAYKTAPELYTHAHVSDIQRQTLESFLDERYVDLVDSVARGRRRTPEEVRAWIDAGPYSPKRAAAAGLIDGMCDEADLPARLLGKPEGKKDDEDEDDEGVEPMPMYRARLPWPPVRWRPLRPKPRLGVVPVSGMIVPGKGTPGRAAGSDTVVKALRAAGRNRRVKAVVLYVASPGGSAVASELILEAVQRVAKKKPVIAFMDQVAASGGYMAALGARELWATPHAVVGSIGVFAGKFDTSELMEKLGVHRTLITRGETAGMYSSARGFTEHERGLMELEMEETYQAFLEHVAKARGRTKEEIHALGEGRVYSGTRALGLGLVDKLGGFEEACRHAMDLAKVPAGRFELQLYGGGERGFSLLKLLLGNAWAGVYAFCPTAWSLLGFKGGERFE